MVGEGGVEVGFGIGLELGLGTVGAVCFCLFCKYFCTVLF